MKKRFCILSGILLCGILVSFKTRKPKGETDPVLYIEVHKTGFGIMAAVPFLCDQFEVAYGLEIDTFLWKDSDTIRFVLDKMNQSLNAPKGYTNVDTRAKLMLYYQSGKTASLCIGTTTIYSRSGRMMEFKDRGLIEMVRSLKK